MNERIKTGGKKTEEEELGAEWAKKIDFRIGGKGMAICFKSRTESAGKSASSGGHWEYADMETKRRLWSKYA